MSPATITRDTKFAEAVDSIAAPVGEYARSIFFDSRFIGAALFNRRGAGEIAGRRAVGRFGMRLYYPALGYFGTHPTPEPAKRPIFTTIHFGAVIALHVDNLMTHHLIAEPDGDTSRD